MSVRIELQYIDHEDGGSMLLINTGIFLPFDTVKHSRRLLFISTAVRTYKAIRPIKLAPVHMMMAAILFYIHQRYCFESYTFF